MTTRGRTGAGSTSDDVDAAVARWAAAAGVPTSVAQAPGSPSPVVVRLLRGVLLGCAFALPLLALGSVDEPGHGLGPALVVGGLWLGVGILLRRREPRAGR